MIAFIKSTKGKLLLLLAVTVFIHSTFIANGFTWLDHHDLEKQHAILPLSVVLNAFVTRYGDTSFYRPMVTIVNSFDYALYKDSASGYHLTNLLIFLAIISILPFFMRSFFSLSLHEGFLAAFIFAIHPLTILPIGAISYRPELLMTFFMLSTFYSYSKVRQTKKKRFIMLFLFSCFAAFFSKETALVLIPGAIILWEITKQTKIISNAEKKQKKMINDDHSAYLLLGLLCGLLFVYSILRLLAVPEIWSVATSFPSHSIALGSRIFILGRLVTLFLFPFFPSISDVTPFKAITSPLVILTICFYSLLLYIILKRGIKDTIAKLLLFFLFFLSPALSIIPVPRMNSPHYGFIALVPFTALVIFIVQNYVNNRSLKISTIMLMTLWSVFALYATFTGGYRFKNDQTLFELDALANKDFHEGYFYLGYYYESQHLYTAAEKAYTQAASQSKHSIAYQELSSTLINLAAVYYQEKKYQQADISLQKAYTVAPQKQKIFILYNRAVIYENQKQYAKTITLLAKKDLHEYPLAYLILADAYHYKHNDEQARSLLEKSLPYWTTEQRTMIEQLIQNEFDKKNK